MSNAELEAIQAELAAGISKLQQEENPTTAREDFALYYQQKAEEAQKVITAHVENMTGYAKTAREALNRTSQWDFAARRKTAARVRELEAKFDAAASQVSEIQNEMKLHGVAGLMKDFDEEVAEHLVNMKRHFKDENFVKDRF